MLRRPFKHSLNATRGLLSILALLLSLLLAGSAGAANYDLTPSGGDDTAAIESLIQAKEAAGGGTVSLAPGTYRAYSDIDLRPGVTLDGNGAVIVGSGEVVVDVVNDTDAGLRNVTLRGATIGLRIANSSRILVENLRTENNGYGSKMEYADQITFVGHVSRGDVQSLYAKWTTDSTWTDLDYDCAISDNGHNIYLERGNADLTFDRVRLAGGGGYSLHLYHEGTTAENSSRILVRNVHLDNPTMGVVVWSFDDVAIENLHGTVQEGYAAFMLNDLERLTVDGFGLAGTPAAFAAYGTLDGPIENVTLRSGVYSQPRLIENSSNVSGLAIENVTSSGEHTTTLEPTDTTTLKATTTTTKATTTTTEIEPPSTTISETTTTTVPEATSTTAPETINKAFPETTPTTEAPSTTTTAVKAMPPSSNRPNAHPWKDVPTSDIELNLALDYVYTESIFEGYPDNSFNPYAPMLRHHVALTGTRAGLPASLWSQDYRPATRAEVAAIWIHLSFYEGRWNEFITRSQMVRLIYRTAVGQ